jgi:hypothetical protein
MASFSAEAGTEISDPVLAAVRAGAFADADER